MTVTFHASARLLVFAAQQNAPTFGAIPSADELKKKRDGQEEEAEKRAEIMTKILGHDARATLNQLEGSQPEKVRSPHNRDILPCPPMTRLAPATGRETEGDDISPLVARAVERRPRERCVLEATDRRHG